VLRLTNHAVRYHRIFVVIATVFAVAANSRAVDVGFTCSCLMESQGTNGQYNKIGIGGCDLNVCAAPVKYFLKQTEVLNEYYYTPDETFTVTYTLVSSYSPDDAFNYGGSCGWYCNPTITQSGTAFETDYGEATLGDDAHWRDGSDDIVDWPADLTDMFDPVSSGCTSPYTDESTDSWTDTDETASYDLKITRSDEFDDNQLKGKVDEQIGDFSDDAPWGSGDTAFYSLTEDHYCASAGKMRYRLKVPNSEAKTSYLLSWNEITTAVTLNSDCSTATNVTTSSQSETIAGTGDPSNPAVGSTHTVDIPSVSGKEISVTISESSPTVVKITSESAAGQ